MSQRSLNYRVGVALLGVLVAAMPLAGCKTAPEVLPTPEQEHEAVTPAPPPQHQQPPSASATGEPERPSNPEPPSKVKAETGEASWYGGPLNGKKTASGKIYDPNAYTAAHNSLPFGTRVRVINLDSGKHVDVVINDRGPHVDGRLIDLSQAAAEAIGIKKDGVQEVRIEVLESGT